MNFWKRQQHLEQLSAMEWYNLVAEELDELRSAHKTSPFKFKINHAQCYEAVQAFSSKLSKFWPHALPSSLLSGEDSNGGSSTFSRRHSSGRQTDSISHSSHAANDTLETCSVLESCKHALKEVYRVIKELQAFLLLCSVEQWWKSPLLRADNGEVLALHIHDLVWSMAALDATLHHAKTCVLEVRDAVCSRRLTECYAEMSSQHHELNELADRKELISMLKKMHEHSRNKGKKKALRALKSIRSLRIDEDIKHRISEHFLQRLQNHDCSALGSQYGLPESLSIDPKDLDFSRRRLIGRGSFGQVYEASWLGMKVAVKELPCADSQLFKEEVSILAKLRSPFIVQLIGWSVDVKANVCHMVMELCSCNLRDHIETRSRGEPPFSLRVAVDIMLQVARGMEYLHSQRVIHRDLRASNILVNGSTVKKFSDEGYVLVKLCDFGMAKAKRNSSKMFSSMKGSTYWRAPEVFSDFDHLESEEASIKPYSDKIDVYSFAMTCYEILTGKIPFEGILRKEIQEVVMKGGRPELPSSCPSLLINFIRQCWAGEDWQRPPFKEICRVLRHVKLLLMRVDDLEDVSFESVTTEFDYVELQDSTRNFSFSSKGGSSCGDGTTEGSIEKTELQACSPASPSISSLPGRLPFQRIRIGLALNNKPTEMGPREVSLMGALPFYITRYSLHDLRNATANFSMIISDGEAGSVSRGILQDDSKVAVKAVKFQSMDEIRPFLIKVVALGNAYHPNLVRFRGYCVESLNHFLFVFDYMENLSLDRWLGLRVDSGRLGSLSNESDISQLNKAESLTWAMRVKIALGVARGLAFLHEDCGQCILPVGVKKSKVLLDRNCEPRLNSLNLVDIERYQYFKHKVVLDQSSTECFGLSHAAVTAVRSDVYRFGIILFELVASHSIDFPAETSEEDGLVSVLNQPQIFSQLLDCGHHISSPDSEDRTGHGLLDLFLGTPGNVGVAEYEPQAVEKAKLLLQTAMWCVQDAESRPTMSQVLRTLEGNPTIPQKLQSTFDALL